MKEILILALIAAAGYLAYDDYYKQRPALEQARQQIQQLTTQDNQVPPRTSAPGNPTRPAWFQKKLNESSSSLERPTPMPQP